MNAKRIDILNIGLIIFSLAIATLIPFELFLFSYAVLGPLHYLTEINWLRERSYFFSANRNWSWVFIAIAALISLYPIFDFLGLNNNEYFRLFVDFIGRQANLFLIIAFLFAICLILCKNRKTISIALIGIVIFSIVCVFYFPDFFLLIGVFMPTLIHVYIFTLLFVLYGAFKAKSKNGYYVGVLLFLVPFIISFIPVELISQNPSPETYSNFIGSNMFIISYHVAKIFGLNPSDNFSVLSNLGLRIQIFIAFAYTYHYLNWFSKTSIIGWKKAISKKGAYLIFFIWISALALYLYDYKTGFIALFALSFLHVLLEFPLNIITIKELFAALKKNAFL